MQDQDRPGPPVVENVPGPVSSGQKPAAYHRVACRLLRAAILLPAVAGLMFGSPGCMTRADRPIAGPDSTLVYTSKLASDVNASITFQLKDSALRDEAKRRDRERGREISRLKKERERLLKLGSRLEKQRKQDEERKAAAEKKAKKSKKSKKSRKSDPDAAASSSKTASARQEDEGSAASRPAPSGSAIPGAAALRDSLAAVESQLRAFMQEDSLADLAPWKQKRPDGSPLDERAVETEEGARIQANIKLENVYTRGRRPLTFHLVWLNPDKKKIFKRMLEYMPNDSSQVLTSSLTVSPSKRAPGLYTIQVFLFRELIAEKILELHGTGHEEEEEGGDETM